MVETLVDSFENKEGRLHLSPNPGSDLKIKHCHDIVKFGPMFDKLANVFFEGVFMLFDQNNLDCDGTTFSSGISQALKYIAKTYQMSFVSETR